MISRLRPPGLGLRICALVGVVAVVPLFVISRAASASISVSTSSIDFGDVPISTPATSEPVTVSVDDGYSVSSVSGGSPAVNVQGCLGFVGPGTCTFDVLFETDDPGPVSATAFLKECPTAGGSCVSANIAVKGNAVSQFLANAPPVPAVDFGDSVPLNTTVTKTVTVTLDAGWSLEPLSQVARSGRGQLGGNGTCSGFVGPGACSIDLIYAPIASTDGGVVSWLFHECLGKDCSKVPGILLEGTGDTVSLFATDQQPTPGINLIDFGDVAVGTTVTKNVVFTLDSSFGLEGVLVSTGYSGDGFTFNWGNCSFPPFVGPGTCTATWSFTPTTTSVYSTNYLATELLQVPLNFEEINVHVQGSGVDASPPAISCTVPAQSVWYGSGVTVPCIASDASAGLADANDASFSLAADVAAGTESGTVATNTHQVCDKTRNCATAGPYTFKVDRKPPQVMSCDSPDGQWHAGNVSLHCTYTDAGSGPASQTVSLTTTVATGTGTSSAVASAGGAQACDSVGNCAPSPASIAGNKVDRKAPTVTYTGNAGSYQVGDTIAITCTPADDLSGLASSTCANANGPAWAFGAGVHALSATATDNVGNIGSGSTSFTVAANPGSLCQLTKQFVETSDNYKKLKPAQRAAIDTLATDVCAKLTQIVPKLTAAQKAALVNGYKTGVQALVSLGWLTQSQANTLKSLADAI